MSCRDFVGVMIENGWMLHVPSRSSTGYSAPVETEDPSLVEEELGPGYAVIPDVYVKFTEIVTAGSGSGVPPSRGVCALCNCCL